MLPVMRNGRRSGVVRTAEVSTRMRSLDAFLHEVAVLFHRMSRAAEELHGQGAMSGGRRSILQELERGPRTVPQMARERSVSRQHIQILVNELTEDGYVERSANPEHKRSPLVHLTPSGSRIVGEMRRRELELLPNLALELQTRDLDGAADTLRKVRRALDGGTWAKQVLRLRRPERSRGAPKTRASRPSYERGGE